MPPYDIQPTPNPNSLKFSATSTPFDVSGMVSASSADEAKDSGLATGLFSIDGITNVFILPQFLTVTKRGDVDWDEILPQIEAVIGADGT